ncbi:phosphomannose isomerase type II C-terminal cupin domain [Pedococcus sp. 2YAF34]|uniref:phosphomannose isomerase type II C-terminal cupin domain n=1 Tax=Pedococcus sp. 2YAF34 TaxID=3233032 RepID=UPI003F9E1A90
MQATGNALDAVFVSHRPWGHFRQFVQNERVTVKVIAVEPGQRLSRQRHSHRSEMWHILDTAIDVEVEGRAWVAQPGEQIWVAQGSIHRMGNSGTKAGRVLEIAFGEFDEADIERLEDDYARQEEPTR